MLSTRSMLVPPPRTALLWGRLPGPIQLKQEVLGGGGGGGVFRVLTEAGFGCITRPAASHPEHWPLDDTTLRSGWLSEILHSLLPKSKSERCSQSQVSCLLPVQSKHITQRANLQPRSKETKSDGPSLQSELHLHQPPACMCSLGHGSPRVSSTQPQTKARG